MAVGTKPKPAVKGRAAPKSPARSATKADKPAARTAPKTSRATVKPAPERKPAERKVTERKVAERKPATAKAPKMGDNFAHYLVDLIQTNHGSTAVAARNTVRMAFEALGEGLRKANSKVKLPGLGIARNVGVAARDRRNPRTGEVIRKKAHKTIKFRVERGLRSL